MPNWCENKLEIQGDFEKLKEFCSKHIRFNKESNNDDFSFETVVPTPDNFDDPKFDWYSWCCDNWGTKWDAAEASVSELHRCSSGYSELSIYFDTAWSPPIPIVDKLVSDYPDLYFKLSFYEPGMFFAGYAGSDGLYDCLEDEIRQFTIDEGFRSQEDWDELDAEQAEYEAEMESQDNEDNN